jgi:hypothetical protein
MAQRTFYNQNVVFSVGNGAMKLRDIGNCAMMPVALLEPVQYKIRHVVLIPATR